MTLRIFAIASALCLTSLSAHADPAGRQLYLDNCSACHRPDGAGIKGAFPALAGDPIVNGDAKAMASRVLNGRGGMPAFKASLSDVELAAVMTFVRGSFGNKAKPVKPAIVAAARGADAAAQVKSGQQAH